MEPCAGAIIVGQPVPVAEPDKIGGGATVDGAERGPAGLDRSLVGVLEKRSGIRGHSASAGDFPGLERSARAKDAEHVALRVRHRVPPELEWLTDALVLQGERQLRLRKKGLGATLARQRDDLVEGQNRRRSRRGGCPCGGIEGSGRVDTSHRFATSLTSARIEAAGN